jgi:hypothetical protein
MYWAEHSSWRVVPSVGCLIVVVRPRIMRTPWLPRGCCAMKMGVGRGGGSEILTGMNMKIVDQ